MLLRPSRCHYCDANRGSPPQVFFANSSSSATPVSSSLLTPAVLPATPAAASLQPESSPGATSTPGAENLPSFEFDIPAGEKTPVDEIGAGPTNSTQPSVIATRSNAFTTPPSASSSVKPENPEQPDESNLPNEPTEPIKPEGELSSSSIALPIESDTPQSSNVTCGQCVVNVPSASAYWWGPAFEFEAASITAVQVANGTDTFSTVAPAATPFNLQEAISASTWVETQVWNTWINETAVEYVFTTPPPLVAASTSVITLSAVLPYPTGPIDLGEYNALFIDPGEAVVTVPAPGKPILA